MLQRCRRGSAGRRALAQKPHDLGSLRAPSQYAPPVAAVGRTRVARGAGQAGDEDGGYKTAAGGRPGVVKRSDCPAASQSPGGGGKIKGFKPHAVAFQGYLIAHESHQRGQIGWTLKATGQPLDKKTAYGLWEWGVR